MHAVWIMLLLLCTVASIQIFGRTMEGLKALGEAQSAPECLGEWSGEGASCPLWGSEAMPPENLLKCYMHICTFWCFWLIAYKMWGEGEKLFSPQYLNWGITPPVPGLMPLRAYSC